MNITFENNEKHRIAFQVLFTIMNESFYSKNDGDIMLSHQLEYISYFSPFSIFWNHNKAFVTIDVAEMTGNINLRGQISIMMIHYQAMDLQVQSLPDYRSTLVLSVISKDFNSSKVHNTVHLMTDSGGKEVMSLILLNWVIINGDTISIYSGGILHLLTYS